MLAVAYGAGCPLPVLGAITGVVLAPPLLVAPVLGLTAAHAIRAASDNPHDDAEGAFLRAIAAELQGGATLRVALAAATERAPELALDEWARRVVAGRPLAALADQLRHHLPATGRRTAAALVLASTFGGASVAVFQGLGQQAADAAALRRERSAATAQVRLSVMVVAGAPIVLMVWLVGTGAIGDLAATSTGRLILGIGTGLELVGLVVVIVMVRRIRHPESQLVLAGDLVVLGLLAGLPFGAALDAAAPHLEPALAAEVAAVRRSAQRHGATIAYGSHEGALQDLLRLAARAVATGAPLTAAIAAFTEETRQAVRLRAVADARRLAVHLLFPLALLILPGFVVLVAGPVVLDGLIRLTR